MSSHVFSIPELSNCYLCFFMKILSFSTKTTVISTFLGYFDSQMKIHLEISWKQNRDS